MVQDKYNTLEQGKLEYNQLQGYQPLVSVHSIMDYFPLGLTAHYIVLYY